MGTSKSFTTPSGGAWTSLKDDITKLLDGSDRVTPGQIVAGTIRALGGLSVLSPGRSTGSASGSSRRPIEGRSARRGGGGGEGGGGGAANRAIGRAASRLAGFGSALGSGGLDPALHALGLEELKGHSAAEVVSAIADHLAEGTDPTEYELLSDALRGALMEAAQLQSDGTYRDLEAALGAYIETHGIEGLVELYLSHYVYDRVWMAVENHVEMKAQGASTAEAMSIAVGNACRTHVESLIQEAKTAGRFAGIDWFGRAGVQLGNELVGELEDRLRTL